MNNMKQYILTDKQRLFFETVQNNTFVIMSGSIRAGKSYSMILISWYYCRLYPKTRVLFLRATYPNLENLLNTVNVMLSEGLINDLKEKKTDELVFHNGSVIKFMSESYDSDKNGSRFLGSEYNILCLDELSEFHKEAFDIMLTRVGSNQNSKCPSKVMCTTNPTSVGWVKQLYDELKNNSRNGWKIIQTNLFDNPTVASNTEYIKTLQSTLTPQQYQKFVMGNWEVPDIISDRAFYQFDYIKHLTTNKGYNSELPLLISMDFNSKPYCYYLIAQKDGNNFNIIDEITYYSDRTKMADNIHKSCDEVLFKFSTHKAGCVIFGDASGRNLSALTERPMNFFNIIEDKLKILKPLINVPLKNPSIVPRIQFINDILVNKYDNITVNISNETQLIVNGPTIL